MARYVSVGGVCRNPWTSTFDERCDEGAHLLQRAVWAGANIVAFPEIFVHHRVEGITEEPLDGPSIIRMSQEARRHGVYVIWPLYTREDGRRYNSAVLLSPDGKIAGVYHKMVPTIDEIESGITPGHQPGVFETDFGRIGVVICFDMCFPEAMWNTAADSAEVIFFCSMYRGGLHARMWAHQTGAYVVSAILASHGRMIDQGGRVLAECKDYESVMVRRINLDRKLMHMGYDEPKRDKILAKYGPKISIEFYEDEGCWAIGSESEEFTIDDIIREFQLELKPDYFDRTRRKRIEALQQLEIEDKLAVFPCPREAGRFGTKPKEA